jgi:nucleolar protein 6
VTEKTLETGSPKIAICTVQPPLDSAPAAMSAPQKLTKKQKKGIAFRDRKTNKSRPNGSDPAGLEDNEVPVLEVQDLADGEDDSPAVEVATKKGKSVDQKSKETRKGKEKAKDSVAPSPAQKKRKRDPAAVDGEVDAAAGQGQDGEIQGPKRKKAKGGNEDSAKEAKAEVKQRFILFVGKFYYPLSFILPTFIQAILNTRRRPRP